ncbi:MAG: F0F1 ATP synthase subunit epsilon [Burkholderiaceae bacterium]
MNLDVLLPSHRLLHKTDVLRIVAETEDGSFGLLPRRRDCVAPLSPGILSFETGAEGEVFVAIDSGVLVKAGADVTVSVRRAMVGADLGTLRAAVEREFLAEDDLARSLRQAMDKLEITFLTRFGALRHD